MQNVLRKAEEAVKNRLTQYKKHRYTVKAAEEGIKEAEAELAQVSQAKDTAAYRKLRRTLARYIKQERNRGGKAREAMRNIEAAIQAVEDHTQREILIMRYVYGKKWESIAATVHYTPEHTQRKHREALKAIADGEGAG